MRKMVAEFHFENNEKVSFLTDLMMNKQEGFKVVRINEDNALDKYELLQSLLPDEAIKFLLYLKANKPDKFESIQYRLNDEVINAIVGLDDEEY